MRAVAEVEPDQVAEQVSVGLCEFGAVVDHEEGHDAGHGLALRIVHAVAVGDAQLPGERVAQQAEGLAGGLRGRTAAQDAHAAARGRQPPLELAQQSALAEASLGDHSDHRQAPFGSHVRKRILQCG
jgi:hypothetical protein